MMNLLDRSKGTTQHSDATGGVEESDRSIAKILNGVIMISLIAIFFGIPLFFTSTTLQGIMFEKQMYFYFWLLIGLAAWAGKGVIIGDLVIRRTPIDIPLLIFWVLCLVATLASVDVWHSFIGSFGDPSRGFMSLTALILLYYMMMSFLDRKRFRILLSSLILSSVLVILWSFLAVMNVQFLPDVIAQYAPVSLMGSFTALAIYLGAMIPLLITGIFLVTASENKGVLHRVMAVVLLLAMLIDLFVLLALFGFLSKLAILIGLGFLLVFVLAKIVQPSDAWIWVPMVSFVGFLLILMINNNQVARINLPIEVSPNQTLSWDIVKESMKSDFFVGSGPAMYEYAFAQYRPESYNALDVYTLRFTQGSGFIFEAIPTIGVLGTIAFVFLLLTFVGTGLFLLMRDREANKIRSLGLWSSALIIVVAAGITTVNGSIVLVGACIGILALSIVLMESQVENKVLRLSLKASPKYALALAFIFMVISAGVAFLFVYIGKAYVADVRVGSAVRAQDLERSEVIQQIDEAIRLNPKEGYYWTRMGQELMALANSEALKEEGEQDINAIATFLREAFASMEKGRELLPNSIAVQESVAQIYENGALYDRVYLGRAEEEYRKAMELEPKNPNYYVKIGQIKLSQAQIEESEETKKALVEEAKELFEKSVQFKENLHAGYYQLALTLEALEELDAAIENMEKAASINSQSINYFFNLARLYQARGNDEDNERAETIYKQILGVNDKEVNVHFSLAMLHERRGKKTEAIEEFERVLELLPQEGSDEARSQVEKMIENIKNGVENTPENIVPNKEQPVPASDPVPVPVPEVLPVDPTEAPAEGGDVPIEDAPVVEAPAEEVSVEN